MTTLEYSHSVSHILALKEVEMWLARDADGLLELYIGGKPNKHTYTWQTPMAEEIIMIDNSLFPEVKWTDEEPTKVKIIIDK